MSSLSQFKKFLKTNLTHVFEIEDVFRGTLIDAYNLDKMMAKASVPTKMPVMIKIMEDFRTRRVEWWEHYQGKGSAWNMIQRSYTQLQIDKHNIPCSIIPFVKEIEKNQLMLCGETELVFCSSCYKMRIENETMKRQIEDMRRDDTRVTGDTWDSDCDAIPEARILREWFEEHFHRNGKGQGYPRNRLRKEVSIFLSEHYGFQADISCNSAIWKWFVQNVVRDTTSQKYRGFRIWRQVAVVDI